MDLHVKQKEIADARWTHRFRVVCAGRRFGKSVLAIEELLFTAISKTTLPNARVAYVAPTFQAARDIVWTPLKQRVTALKPEINESRLDMLISNEHGGKSFLALRSWDNIETLRGQYFDLIVLDEVAMYRNFHEGWDNVLRPTLTDRKGKGLFISTPRGFNHFYELFSISDPSYKSFHFTTYDNPVIDKNEIDEAKRTLPDDTFHQEYLAEFRKMQGLLYPEFDRKRHVYTEAKFDANEYVGGVDFAYSHACAVLSVKKDYNGNYWVTDEMYRSQMTDLQIAEYVAAQNYNKVYPDPAQPQGIEELRRHGVNVYEVVKSPDSVEKGIARIRELLKQGRLKVHASCVNTITEFETYARDPDTGKIIKEGDDAMDALRYVIMMMEAAQNQQHVRAVQSFLDMNRARITQSSTR